jgi:hypothetical protein
MVGPVPRPGSSRRGVEQLWRDAKSVRRTWAFLHLIATAETGNGNSSG